MPAPPDAATHRVDHFNFEPQVIEKYYLENQSASFGRNHPQSVGAPWATGVPTRRSIWSSVTA
jgi:hypothetical protein